MALSPTVGATRAPYARAASTRRESATTQPVEVRENDAGIRDGSGDSRVAEWGRVRPAGRVDGRRISTCKTTCATLKHSLPQTTNPCRKTGAPPLGFLPRAQISIK